MSKHAAFKCAIVGVSGSRANGHAKAYGHITRGALTAISTRRQDKLDAFGDEYGIAARYTDYREMLDRERPDLVHVNTPPNVRLEILQAAEAAGIPAVIVEKPLAIQWEDFLALRDFARTCRLKVAVNHQLHFHPRRAMLQHLVREGRIGDIRFIDASARMNMAYQGTHILQAIGAFNTALPVSVFAQASGVGGLQENPRQHYAPDRCLAAIAYDDGSSALLRCGDVSPAATGSERVSWHKRIAVHGTRGFIHWTMESWEMAADGRTESGRHDYFEEDVLGQAAMTEAMFDWIEDDARVHPLNIDSALRDFHIVLNTYMSALTRGVLKLDEMPRTSPQANLVAAMRERLG